MANLKGLTALVTGLWLAGCTPEPEDKPDAGNTDSQDAGYVMDSGFPDGNYIPDASVDGGNDGGSDSGNVSDGGSDNLAPVVTLQTLDYNTRQPKTVFARGEKVLFYVTAEDPDCNKTDTCGNSKGIKECYLKDNLNSLSRLLINQNGNAETYQTYPWVGDISSNVECSEKFDSDIKGLSTTEFKIN